MSNPKKRSHCHSHARRRAEERFGLALNKEKIRGLIKQIQSGAAKFLYKQSLTRSHFLVEIAGRNIPVVYDKKRKAIVTVLPEEALGNAEYQVVG